MKNKNNGQKAVLGAQWKKSNARRRGRDGANMIMHGTTGKKHINFMAKYNKVSLNYNFFPSLSRLVDTK